jgi:hypothetical protein
MTSPQRVQNPGSESTEQDQQFRDSQEKLRDKVLNVIDQIDDGFSKAGSMYSIAFYFGIFVVTFSMVATLFYKQNVDNNTILFFGSVGIIDIVAFFVFKPINDLQKSRANLAQLVSAFLYWYVNVRNWDAATRKEIRTPNPTNIDNLERISKRHLIDTISILVSMHNILVEERKGEDTTEKLNKTITKIKETIGN